jgi:hypothetical protein
MDQKLVVRFPTKKKVVFQRFLISCRVHLVGKVKVKVKFSRYRTELALGDPEC